MALRWRNIGTVDAVISLNCEEWGKVSHRNDPHRNESSIKWNGRRFRALCNLSVKNSRIIFRDFSCLVWLEYWAEMRRGVCCSLVFWETREKWKTRIVFECSTFTMDFMYAIVPPSFPQYLRNIHWVPAKKLKKSMVVTGRCYPFTVTHLVSLRKIARTTWLAFGMARRFALSWTQTARGWREQRHFWDSWWGNDVILAFIIYIYCIFFSQDEMLKPQDTLVCLAFTCAGGLFVQTCRVRVLWTLHPGVQDI